MVQTFPVKHGEYEDAKDQEAVTRGEPVELRLAVVDYCRREGFVHGDWFYFIETRGHYYKTQYVDKFIELGGEG